VKVRMGGSARVGPRRRAPLPFLAGAVTQGARAWPAPVTPYGDRGQRRDVATAVEQQAMQRAIALASAELGRTGTNPVVGAVVLDSSGVVVGEGAHVGGPGNPHAEILALVAAGSRRPREAPSSAASSPATTRVVRDPAHRH